MKKLTFKVSSQKDSSVISFIKEVNKISCRIYLDLENGFVAVENVNGNMLDTVIELIDKHYTISGVNIDNTIDVPVEKQTAPVVVESVEESTTGNIEESTAPEAVEITSATEGSTDKVAETTVLTEETTNKVVNTKATTKKVGSKETALLEAIGFALDKLDVSKNVEDQVEGFLTDIGMTTNERMVTQAFIVACKIEKINYENVILELHKMYPKVNKDIIKSILQEAFKKWLEQYPTVAEKCYKISLMAVLNLFAKKFS